VKGDRIIRVGTTEEVSYLIGKDTQIVYLDWRCVVPGLIDTHIHLGDYARFLMWVDLIGAASIQEVQARLKQRVENLPKGKWVVGRGWNEKKFAEKCLPNRQDLDEVSPENPVIFYYSEGPVSVVNSLALQVANITKATVVPEGGAIDKDPQTGEPTGILRDGATDLAWSKVPESTEEELVEAAVQACQNISAAGITSIHWLATSKADVSLLRNLVRRGQLPLRVYMVVPDSYLDGSVSFEGLNGESAKVGAAEVSLDGYLAMRTAALSEPYLTNPPMNTPLLCTREALQDSVQKIVAQGYQPILHAMGDKAVDAALKALESVPQERRPRIDPAALLNAELVERFKAQNVVVSVQPLVAASEWQVYHTDASLGEERAKWLYPLKILLQKGVRVCGGSDCPMEPLNPMLGLNWLITRQFPADEQVTINEAIRMYTVNAAYATGEENHKGTVEEGKLADLTILSNDPREVAPAKIRDITVDMTIVAGKPVFMR
jgi:predicted amidohydrolase YtcJ